MHREERIIKIRKNNAVSLFAILVDNLTSPPELICGHTNLFDNEINWKQNGFYIYQMQI